MCWDMGRAGLPGRGFRDSLISSVSLGPYQCVSIPLEATASLPLWWGQLVILSGEWMGLSIILSHKNICGLNSGGLWFPGWKRSQAPVYHP